MSENCDGKLRRELGDEALFFEIGPFSETLGQNPDVGGGGGGGDGDDGDNGDGTYTARDKAHANELFRNGYQGNVVMNSAMATAAIEWFKANEPGSYNFGKERATLHKVEQLIKTDGRDMKWHDIASFEGVPGLHHLLNDIESSMDLRDQQNCATFFLGGETSVGKTAILKAVVSKLFGQGVFIVNSLEHIADHASKFSPDVPLLMDDMSFRTTVNGQLANLESVKGLLEQSDSTVSKEVMCRAGKNSKIPFNVIKCGTSQWSSIEEMYNGSDSIVVSIPENQKAAIRKRCNFRYLHKYRLPSGELVDLNPIMTPDHKQRFKNAGFRVDEETVCRWPLFKVDIGVPHPNAHEPWAYPRDDDGDDGDDDDDMTPPP